MSTGKNGAGRENAYALSICVLDRFIVVDYNLISVVYQIEINMAKMSEHSVFCGYCEKSFTALSNSASYCSNSCRCAAYRRRKRHTDNRPMNGVNGKAALMYTDVYNANPKIAAMLQTLRDRKGPTVARDALYIVVAAIWPGVLDPTMTMYDFYMSELPDDLKGIAS